MERRFTSNSPIKIEDRSEGEPLIVGYASVFYDGSPGTEYNLYDDFVERIAPGAFTRALQEQQDVRGLFNHDANLILGRTVAKTLSLSVDNRGLRYEIIPPETSVATNLVTSIRRGDVSGSSFSFRVARQTWTEIGDLVIRLVEDVDLYDVGPVTFPAYKGADSGVRAWGDGAEARAAFEQWRSTQKRGRRMDVKARARAIQVRV